MSCENIVEQIQALITKNKVFLFMKGSPEKPMCGFSGHVAAILQELGVAFDSFDILQDQEMRQAIKEFSDWPTLPQLYINGQFVGGCDIVDQLYKSGELARLCSPLCK